MSLAELLKELSAPAPAPQPKPRPKLTGWQLLDKALNYSILGAGVLFSVFAVRLFPVLLGPAFILGGAGVIGTMIWTWLTPGDQSDELIAGLIVSAAFLALGLRDAWQLLMLLDQSIYIGVALLAMLCGLVVIGEKRS